MKEVSAAKAKANGASVDGGKDAGAKGKDDGLRIPESAIKEGIKVVKKELEKVCEVH